MKRLGRTSGVRSSSLQVARGTISTQQAIRFREYGLMSHRPSNSTAPYLGQSGRGAYRLWVDGVGAYLLCLGNQITIGGPSGSSEDKAEISLLANLSRQHVRLIRSGEVWLLEPLGPVQVDERPIVKHSLLNDGNCLRLGSSVILRFRSPSPLSGTARLDFESSHRTQPSVDGVILFAETCVIGPGSDAHIRSVSATATHNDGSVLLIRRADGLWCKSVQPIQIDGTAAGLEVACEPDRVYSGPNWRFRMEGVD